MQKPVIALVVALILVTIGALAFRLPALEDRPMHGDEANQAHRTGVLLETGVYEYDPAEHHGPTLYYFMLPILRLAGVDNFGETTEFQFRLLPVLFGVALIPLLLLIGDGLGRREAVVAAVFTAISPAMVFYSRYFIQETLLVTFTFAAIVCGWRYYCSRRLGWAVAAGLSLGLMHATKETCVLAFAAMAGGLAVAWVWAQYIQGREADIRKALPARHIIYAMIAGAVVSVVLFSSFFTHARGPLDSILTYGSYIGRAAADPTRDDGAHLHHHPWYFYLQILLFTRLVPGTWWSEGLIVALAVIGAVIPWRRHEANPRRGDLIRFLTVYTILLTAIYSVIPYKTPWCLIGFLHGMILLAGVGTVTIVRLVRYRALQALVILVVVALSIQLAMQTYRANFVFPADRRNPYVYAHTAPSLVRLAERIEEIAEHHPGGEDMPVFVITMDGDYWPLPWYLRRMNRVGYFTTMPDPLEAPVLVAPPDIAPVVYENLQYDYQIQHYALRPGVLMILFIRQDLWDEFMTTRVNDG